MCRSYPMEILVKKVRYFLIGNAICNGRNNGELDYENLELVLEDLTTPYLSDVKF